MAGHNWGLVRPAGVSPTNSANFGQMLGMRMAFPLAHFGCIPFGHTDSYLIRSLSESHMGAESPLLRSGQFRWKLEIVDERRLSETTRGGSVRIVSITRFHPELVPEPREGVRDS